MEVSVEVHKIIKWTMYSIAFFFTSVGGVDDVLVKLLIIKQIFKDANLMSISFSVKHPQTFRELQMSLFNMTRIISNMYTYPFNPQLLVKT